MSSSVGKDKNSTRLTGASQGHTIKVLKYKLQHKYDFLLLINPRDDDPVSATMKEDMETQRERSIGKATGRWQGCAETSLWPKSILLHSCVAMAALGLCKGRNGGQVSRNEYSLSLFP